MCSPHPPPVKRRSVQGPELRKMLGYVRFNRWAFTELVAWAVENASPNVVEFKSVLRCGRELRQTENKYLRPEKPCGSRLCNMCSRRRAAHVGEAINPLLKAGEWDFVTLNASNTDIPWGKGVGYDAQALKLRMSKYWDMLNKVRDGIRHEFKVSSIDAIVTMECTKRPFSPPNPHIHMLVPAGMGDAFVRHWVKQATRYGLNAVYWDGLQDARKSPNLWKPVTNKPASKRELLKYVMAPVVKVKEDDDNLQDVNLGGADALGKAIQGRMIDLGGTDAIVTAFKGTRRFRLWGRFYGLDKDVKRAETEDVDELVGERVEYVDIPEGCHDTGPDVVVTKTSLDDRGCRVLIKKVQPAFVRDVLWVFCPYRQDWCYTCSHTGLTYALTHAPPPTFPELWPYDRGKRWYKTKSHE